MKLGVCYYPEHWPQERWPIDARLMRQAGLSLVRIADFAWAALEADEGEYSWQWLDRAIEVLAGEGLKVVLCTPTASPPPWITHADPDILLVDGQGRRRRHGSRRHYCPNNATFHRHTVRIVSAMGSRYGRHPAVVAWQIDNEFGCHYSARCYCDTCAVAFRRWLEAKYLHIESLNAAWGNIFWGQIYKDWDEIVLPNLTVAEANPSHVLDHYRFASDTFVDYLNLQITTLRPLIPAECLITTNFMSQFTDLNYHELAAPLDLVSVSSYPTGHGETAPSFYEPAGTAPAFSFDVGDPYNTRRALTLMRGFKPERPFWIMEQQAGNVNWGAYNTGVRPGAIRLWTWHAVVSGAEAVLYFRWRAGLYAQEQMHSGLLHHDGSPDVGYRDLESMKGELELMSEIASARHEAQIAILLDYDSLWALQLQPHNRDFDYMRLLFVYFRALQRLGLPTDIVSAGADLSPYKLVIVPSAYLATGHQVDGLMRCAQAGGTVLLGVRSGFKNGNNQVIDDPLPGIFRRLVSITVSDWHSLPPGVSYDLESSIPGLSGQAAIWAEALQLSTGDSQGTNPEPKALVSYKSGPFASRTALYQSTVGNGRALYIGWYPNDRQAQALLSFLAGESGVESLATLPDGLLAARRGDHLILLNFTDQALEANVAGQSVSVGTRDVEIVKLLQS